MSFETIERLKHEYTDKYVVVDPHTPELKRFVGLTGTVKTVNMSGRALVEFDGAVDISWYDIDLAYLTVVDQPIKKQPVAAHAAAGEKTEKKAAAPAAKPAGKSPLELAREQAAAKAGGAPAGEKPLSKIEQARLQAAAAKGGAAPAAAKPPAPAAPARDKPLSKIELARQQAAAKKAAEAAPAEDSALAATGGGAAEAEPAPAPALAAPAPKAAGGQDTSGLSKIELARRQGAFKG